MTDSAPDTGTVPGWAWVKLAVSENAQETDAVLSKEQGADL